MSIDNSKKQELENLVKMRREKREKEIKEMNNATNKPVTKSTNTEEYDQKEINSNTINVTEESMTNETNDTSKNTSITEKEKDFIDRFRFSPKPTNLPTITNKENAEIKIKENNDDEVFVTEEPIIKENFSDNIIEENESENTEIKSKTDSIEDDFIENTTDNENINIDIDIDIENTSKTDENIENIKKSSPVKIGSTGSKKSIKKISSFNPGNNIKVVEDDDYQRAVVEQYITKTSSETFTGPKSVTRVILPYSGIYLDISSYTNNEMLGIHRSTTEISFVEKIEKELYSAWEHTVNNSFKKKMEFDEWLRNIKYPDLWCIYWAIYNVNHPGINTYTSKCDYCSEIFEEKRDNYNISYVSENSENDINQDVINKIRNGADREVIKSYKIASTLIEKEGYLPDKKFKVFHGMPNMEDVLVFLKYLKVDLEESDELIQHVLYPISSLNLNRFKLSKSTVSKILYYKYIMYTKKVYAPVFETIKPTTGETKSKIKATYVNVLPIMIYPLINSLSKEDFKELVKSKALKKLMIKEGIHFRLKDSVCPVCKKKQIITVLDMRDILFIRAEALTDFLMNM
jgi:hypothetical protein